MIVTFLMVVFNIIFEGKNESLWLKIGMFLLGLGGSLIMENVTVFSVVMPILLQIYLWVKEKRFSPALLIFTIGAVIGAVLMFTNSAYTNIASAQDGYRTMSFSVTELIMRAKENYVTAIHPYGLFKNVVLIMSLFLGGLLFLGGHEREKDGTKNHDGALAVVCDFGRAALCGDADRAEELFLTIYIISDYKFDGVGAGAGTV